MNNLQLEVDDKILRVVFEPYPHTLKVGKNQYFEMYQTHIC